MNTFYKDLERGKVGEQLVQDTFSSLGYYVEDTSNNPDYFKDDIDFIVADGFKYEVKTDYRMNDTGNIALEDSTWYFRDGSEKQSWLWTSKADYFCFVNPYDIKQFYVIKTSDLRQLVKIEGFRTVDFNDDYKVNTIVLLPYKKYLDCFEIVETEVE